MKNLSVLLFISVLFGAVLFPQEAISAEISAISLDIFPRSGNILYVNPDGTSVSCSTWEDACSLQTALAHAVDGDEIWVAEGTYHPHQSDPDIYFSLKSGVDLYGGFEGIETALNQRNWKENVTILSGDLGVLGEPSDNSHLIVFGSTLDASTILDGFTIRDGYNPTGFTGGIYLYSSFANLSNLVVTNNTGNQGGGLNITNGGNNLNNVTFLNNHAELGGGVYSTNSNPIIIESKFINNTANYGAGMYSITDCSPSLLNVIFSSNVAEQAGGGMFNYDSASTLTNVRFENNYAQGVDLYDNGGGMYNQQSSTTLENVLFSGNQSAHYGGGMYNLQSSTSSLTNVTFSGNSAVRGGGMMNWISSDSSILNVTFINNSATESGGGLYNYNYSTTEITSGIFWGNTPGQIYNSGSNFGIQYSDVQGGCPTGEDVMCDKVMDANPLLLNLADNGGFTLTHALGEGSPAIDKGHPTDCPAVDQRGYERPIDGDGNGVAVCDIGAFEFGAHLPYHYNFLPLVLQ